MHVSEMIENLGLLSVGLDNLSNKDKDVFLKYLNLVHFDLYRLTALVNPYVESIKSINATIFDNIDRYIEGINPFHVDAVYFGTGANATILKQTTKRGVLAVDPELTATGNPTNWYINRKNKICIYPTVYTDTITVVYIQQPIKLTLNDVETDVPYPPAYHQILVDGAAYYIYQSEGGLKNRDELATALLKYNAGKMELMTYLNNAIGTGVISTYSRV
jgi:hypothetical protein